MDHNRRNRIRHEEGSISVSARRHIYCGIASAFRAKNTRCSGEAQVIEAPKPLTVEGRFTSPDAATLKRIDDEKPPSRAYNMTNPHALCPGRSDGRWTRSSPNVRRAQNVQWAASQRTPRSRFPRRSRHSFLPPILERWFLRASFFEGKLVILDHGRVYSRSTCTSPSSRCARRLVKRGQELGESGATGRVTGPHFTSASCGGAP